MTHGRPPSWPPELPRSLDYPDVPVGSILRAAARRWGDRPAFIDHDVPADLHRAGRAGARRRRAGSPTTASGAGTSSPSTSPTAGSTRRSTTGSCWPAPSSPPPTRCSPPPTWPPSSPMPGAKVLITWDQVLPFVRGALDRTPVETIVVSGESAHRRLRRPAASSTRTTSTSPTCSPATPPTGTWTPASTRPPTSPTWPTPAARRASARASNCRTATSSSTCCSRPAGPPGRYRRSTRRAT